MAKKKKKTGSRTKSRVSTASARVGTGAAKAVAATAVAAKAGTGAAPEVTQSAGQLVSVWPSRLELVHSDSEVDMDRVAILDVILAAGEERMTQAMEEWLCRRDAYNQQLGKMREQLRVDLQRVADAHGASCLAALKNSDLMGLLRLPKGVGSSVNVVAPVRGDNGRWGKIEATVYFTLPHGGYKADLFQWAVSLETPKHIIEQMLAAARLEEQVTAAYDSAMEWKQKLAQLPRLERVERAKLSEERLRSSEESAAVLDRRLADLDADIASLPKA